MGRKAGVGGQRRAVPPEEVLQKPESVLQVGRKFKDLRET